ncbi:hypothetical protein, partial [Brucella melitensis]|uniref:hypothetical protein n=1 Tax=Brucella melitensis TaxID=29459 RepID=UPI001FFE062A
SKLLANNNRTNTNDRGRRFHDQHLSLPCLRPSEPFLPRAAILLHFSNRAESLRSFIGLSQTGSKQPSFGLNQSQIVRRHY